MENCRKEMKKQILQARPVQDVPVGDYNYFVETPDNEFLYFNTKKQANEFIEFYRQYTEKRNAKSVSDINN